MAMFDYARMMGLQNLGPGPIEYQDDEYGMALEMREDAPTQHQQPWLKQDYSGANPYDEGAHGGWLDDGMMGMMDGMGMFDNTSGSTAPDAGLEIPLEEDVDEELEGGEDLFLAPHEGDGEAETQAMLDEEMDLDEDSADFQMGGMEDEGY